MQATTPGLALTNLSKKNTLNTIAILTTIVVGGFTIYYLMRQTKYLRLQIEKHEAENGKSKK